MLRNYIKRPWFIVSILVFTLFLFAGVDSVSANIGSPKGSYYFSDKDTLSSEWSTNKVSVMDIKKKKQVGVFDGLVAMEKNKYADTGITVDLDTNKDYNFWEDNPSILQYEPTSTLMYVRMGSVKYTIYIPKGMDEYGNSVNETVIENTIKGINEYKNAVLQGVIIGSLSTSYNVYNMYPEKQVPVDDILEPARDSDGRDLGYKAIKTSVVKMHYTLDYYFNPLFGKMDKTVVLSDKVDWAGFADRVKFTPIIGSEGRADLSIDPDFFKFTQNADGEKDILTPVSSTDVGNDRVKGWQAALSGRWGNPKLVVDGTMRLAVPYVFVKDSGTNMYSVDETEGYRTIPDVRLSISRSWMFKRDGENFKMVGDFVSYDIDTSKMALFYAYEKDDGGKVKKVGAVVPSEYKEAVVVDQDSAVSITGRKIILSNEYTSRLTLDDKNKDLFAVNTSLTGNTDVKVRNYAFDVEATPEKGTGHKELGTSPEKFALRGDFVEGGEGVAGFVMYMNNAYIRNDELLQWLESGAAKAQKGVSADRLISIIKGDFKVESSELDYAQFQSMAEIKAELDGRKSVSFRNLFVMISQIFGCLLILYTGILLATYWIDLNNPFFTTSIFHWLTFKKMYPIGSERDLDYIIKEDKVRYVTLPKLVFGLCMMVAAGMLFLNAEFMLKWLYEVYLGVSDFFGGGL